MNNDEFQQWRPRLPTGVKRQHSQQNLAPSMFEEAVRHRTEGALGKSEEAGERGWGV